MSVRDRLLALPRLVFSRFADNTNEDSVASRMRRERLEILTEVFDEVEHQPIRVLDVGGSPGYWAIVDQHCDYELDVTVLNLHEFDRSEVHEVHLVVGDARDLSAYETHEFDVAYSNSVIEHVGAWEDQAAMAREVARVGRRYVVQTPNYWFPVEPHFVFPLFQYLPVRIRAELHRRFRLGWMPAAGERAKATANVRQIQLLTGQQVRKLFPDAELITERFLGLPKSLIARR
ncbi:MAG: class I SAM-dependent methyltransferase [Acidimicrobiales bacterium]